MYQLHLIIEDLLLPRDILQSSRIGLKPPFLTAVLARSEKTKMTCRTLEDILCENFGVDSVAPVRAMADGLIVGAEYWMCADPVHFDLQQSQVIMQPEVLCRDEEAAALILDLNRHFEQDGLTFIAHDPRHWYVRSETISRVTTTPLRVASWRDVKPYQPQGEEALHWRRLSNEIQMLLHEHPVNTVREASGLPTINSLWLWGGGCASSIDSNLGVVGGDESLISSFAKAGGISYASSVEEMLNGNQRYGLRVQTALATAWQRGDLYAWHEALQHLEREVMQPLWQAVRQGRLQTLTLDVLSEAETRRFVFDRSTSWKLWRRATSLSDHVV